MNIDDITKEWEKDGPIDEANISRDASNVPFLHNKYYRWYVNESLKLRKAKAEYKILVRTKSEWFKGNLDAEELKELGWEPQPLRILNSEIPSYVESDPEVVRKTLILGMHEETVAYLESIIRQINNRNFLLKTIVDFEKFRSGS